MFGWKRRTSTPSEELKFDPAEVLLTCCDGNASNYSVSDSGPVESSFTNHTWVAATHGRKGAHSMGVLTTRHGLLMEGQKVDFPYDRHVDFVLESHEYRRSFQQTVADAIDERGLRLIVVYSGGCQLNKYLDLLAPVAMQKGCCVLGFGKPMNRDGAKTEKVLSLLCAGTSIDEIRELLDHPETLCFFPAD